MIFYYQMKKARTLFYGFFQASLEKGGSFFRPVPVLVFLILILQTASFPIWKASADDGNPTGEVIRQTTITISFNRYQWWVIRWYDNKPLCSVYVDHEGWPTGNEIYTACGKIIYTYWASTPACEPLPDVQFSTQQCAGAYLFMVGFEPAQKEIEVELPTPKVWISLVDCPRSISEKRCDKLPSLLIEGEEPLPNETITAVHARWDNQEFNCPGTSCKIPASPTTRVGASVEFWVDSSFGDSSEHFTALVRVLDTGVSNVPGGGGWYVDVLSTQWKGRPVESCAQIWDVFPPVEELPGWLKTPAVPELLASDENFHYLAGRLISQGLVQAMDCPANGLLPNGYADTCGLEKALPLVKEWQNRFDKQIIQASQQTGIPAQLMKNMFAQESQFWPGAFKDPKEFGLGQLTDNGAETILLWNQSFFDQFCPLVLDQNICKRGYVYLGKEDQAVLRGALASKASVDCVGCEAGIDLTNIDFSINLFAQTLLANCSQVSRIIFNATNHAPADVSDYVNLWKFTVANYHIGPGCLSYAIYQASASRSLIDWETVSTYLTPSCQGVKSYIEKITK